MRWVICLPFNTLTRFPGILAVFTRSCLAPTGWMTWHSYTCTVCKNPPTSVALALWVISMRDRAQRPLKHSVLQHTLEKEREGGKNREEKASIPVKVIMMLVYRNTAKHTVIDHWCPEVPPRQPHLINSSTWTELALWTKQCKHGRQHVRGHSLYFCFFLKWSSRNYRAESGSINWR